MNAKVTMSLGFGEENLQHLDFILGCCFLDLEKLVVVWRCIVVAVVGGPGLARTHGGEGVQDGSALSIFVTSSLTTTTMADRAPLNSGSLSQLCLVHSRC